MSRINNSFKPLGDIPDHLRNKPLPSTPQAKNKRPLPPTPTQGRKIPPPRPQRSDVEPKKLTDKAIQELKPSKENLPPATQKANVLAGVKNIATPDMTKKATPPPTNRPLPTPPSTPNRKILYPVPDKLNTKRLPPPPIPPKPSIAKKNDYRPMNHDLTNKPLPSIPITLTKDEKQILEKLVNKPKRFSFPGSRSSNIDKLSKMPTAQQTKIIQYALQDPDKTHINNFIDTVKQEPKLMDTFLSNPKHLASLAKMKTNEGKPLPALVDLSNEIFKNPSLRQKVLSSPENLSILRELHQTNNQFFVPSNPNLSSYIQILQNTHSNLKTYKPGSNIMEGQYLKDIPPTKRQSGVYNLSKIKEDLEGLAGKEKNFGDYFQMEQASNLTKACYNTYKTHLYAKMGAEPFTQKEIMALDSKQITKAMHITNEMRDKEETYYNALVDLQKNLHHLQAKLTDPSDIKFFENYSKTLNTHVREIEAIRSKFPEKPTKSDAHVQATYIAAILNTYSDRQLLDPYTDTASTLVCDQEHAGAIFTKIESEEKDAAKKFDAQIIIKDDQKNTMKFMFNSGFISSVQRLPRLELFITDYKKTTEDRVETSKKFEDFASVVKINNSLTNLKVAMKGVGIN